jgi:hypothetical protein
MYMMYRASETSFHSQLIWRSELITASHEFYDCLMANDDGSSWCRVMDFPPNLTLLLSREELYHLILLT